ncbi:MAG: AAA family ATPase [Parcubacteria group bacterium]
MNNIILLGGTQGTGKTTLAKKIAEDFKIPWISTDQIRSIMKVTTNKELEPYLFPPSTELDLENLIVREIKQGEAVWSGVLALINNIYPWEKCIIEGTAIFPHLVARDLKEKDNITPIFLLQSDIEVITKTVEERSKMPWIKTKTKEQQEQKVQLIIAINEKIKKDALNYKYKAIESNDCKDNFDDFIRTL